MLARPEASGGPCPASKDAVIEQAAPVEEPSVWRPIYGGVGQPTSRAWVNRGRRPEASGQGAVLPRRERPVTEGTAEFSATQRDAGDGAPGATAAFPYDRMNVERFREAFPR